MPRPAEPEQPQRRRPQPCLSSPHGSIYYTPRGQGQSDRRRNGTPPGLPVPLISPRPRRPHSIHILSYPPGFVPHDLRQKANQQQQQRLQLQQQLQQSSLSAPSTPSTRVNNAKQVAKEARRREKERRKQEKAAAEAEKTRRTRREKRNAVLSLPAGLEGKGHHHGGHYHMVRVLDKLFAALSITTKPSTLSEPPTAPCRATGTTSVATGGGGGGSVAGAEGARASSGPDPRPRPRPRPTSLINFTRRWSRLEPESLVPEEDPASTSQGQPQQQDREVPQTQQRIREQARAEALQQLQHNQYHGSRPGSLQSQSHSQSRSTPLDQQSHMADAARLPLATQLGNAVGNSSSQRNSVMSMRSAKNFLAHSSVSEIQKLVASGSGLSCSIILAEPNIFLTGFDHDGYSRSESLNTTALLRGKLQLEVSKNVKIKSVTLKLTGKARTEWPEGIPPLKLDMFEEVTLRTQSLVFFHAMHEWENEFGNQCTVVRKENSSGAGGGISSGSQAVNLRHSLYSNVSQVSLALNRSRQNSNLTAKELKRLSLQSVNSHSVGKGEWLLAHQAAAKGYKIFPAGTYEYNFELPIDHHQLETTKLQYGSVKWELETMVERAGAFKPNLHGAKEVCIVRVPDQMSLETTEPISISRQWEDQLHYDIMISGKSFPIGSKIPIAFKLTPLAKVQVHKLKVFVTETIEYWTNDRRVTRKDPGRKILLLEKVAGKAMAHQFAASDVSVLSGGELTAEQRSEARHSATRRRTCEAARAGRLPDPLPDPTENILGDLDLGLEAYWGSTEIEMNVQMPTCEMMAKDKTLRLHPDCSWKNVNVYHWIKIIMRISRLDPEDPLGKKRRHFEISIDSPFTVLNCRATQANTALPEYADREGPPQHQQQHFCGCPDAVPLNSSPSNSSSNLPLVEQESVQGGLRTGRLRSLDRINTSALPAAPQAAYLEQQVAGIGAAGAASDLLVASTVVAAPAAGTTTGVSRGSREETVIASPSRAERPSQQPQPYVYPPTERERPIHLIRVPSYSPPNWDADVPPPSLAETTPPPRYDTVVGTPSVDGLADYFARLSEYEDHFDGGSARREREREEEQLATEAIILPAAGLGVIENEEADDEGRMLRRPAPNRMSTISTDSTDTVIGIPHPLGPAALVATSSTNAPTSTTASAAASTDGAEDSTSQAAEQRFGDLDAEPSVVEAEQEPDPFSTNKSSVLDPPEGLLAILTGQNGFGPAAASPEKKRKGAGDGDDDSDSGPETVVRPHEGGRVNVANPRTSGGRLVPSRSLEFERPAGRTVERGELGSRRVPNQRIDEWEGGW